MNLSFSITAYSKDVSVDNMKFIFVAALFIATFISSLVPLYLMTILRNELNPEKRVKYSRILSILNCFAEGVFLGVALLVFFPGVVCTIKEAVPNTSFPFAEFIISFGFLAILSVEQIVIDFRERTSDSRNPIERLQSRNVQLDREKLTIINNQEEQNVSNDVTQILQEERNENLQSIFHSLILCNALSWYSFFEGLCIDHLLTSETTTQLFIAILLHKVSVGFSLGLNLVQSKLKILNVIQLNLWFSLMLPVGAIIGSLSYKIIPCVQLKLLNGILEGITTGTFIFIIFIEIIPKQGRIRLLNLLFLIIGFSCVCISLLLKMKYSIVT